MRAGATRKSLGLPLALVLRQANRKAIGLAMTSFLVLLGSPANVAAVNFTGPQSYPVGTSPAAIAVGDFNGDSKLDIAVANAGSGDVSLLLGNGDGTFQAAVNYSAGNSPNAIATGDFNGDGKLDLALFQASVNGVGGSISILLGNGDGTFQAAKTLALSSPGLFMAVADFNVDKKADLAVCDSTNLDIFIGNGDGTFEAAQNTALSSGCLGLITADFNGDSKPDLAVEEQGHFGVASPGIQILLGKGDGTFSQGSFIDKNGVVAPVIAADLNQDGKVDLVVSSSIQTNCFNTCQTARNISVFLGNGDGSFQSGQIVASESFFGPRGPALDYPLVGDFNGDGKLDLAYRTNASGGLSSTLVFRFLLGKGDGSFSLPVLDVSNSVAPIVQDLNADKLADLIAVGTANDINVWLNTSPASGADLSLISPSAGPLPSTVGTNLTFTADVINQGPQDATGVTFTDTLPAGTSFVSALATQGSCVQSVGVVTCAIGSLASAFDASVNIVATPTAVGSITNTMNVTANEPDLAPANNSATQTVSVVPVFMLTVTDAGSGSGTVTSNPGSINCGSTCSGSFAQGTSVSLTAVPSPSSVFSAWSGACTGTDPNTCTLVMNSAQSVTATFAPAPDFTLSAASTNITLQTGAQTTDTLTLTPQNGLSGQVNLSCTVNGSAPLASCAVSPSSVTLGPNPGNSMLTLTAPSSLTTYFLPWSGGSRMTRYAVVLPVPILLIVGIGLGWWRLGRRRVALSFLFGSLIALFILAGCGGGTLPAPKSYTVTVNATSASGTPQHSATINLTVN